MASGLSRAAAFCFHFRLSSPQLRLHGGVGLAGFHGFQQPVVAHCLEVDIAQAEGAERCIGFAQGMHGRGVARARRKASAGLRRTGRPVSFAYRER